MSQVQERKTLQEALSIEFINAGEDSPAWKYRDVEVLKEFDGRDDRWPGAHKNVFKWFALANGKAVGWNEKPARGASFPVISLMERE